VTEVAAPETPLPPPVGARRRRWKVVALALVAVGVVLDLLTKAWIADLLGMHPNYPEAGRRISLIPGFLAFEGTWNTGVTFGLAQGHTSAILIFTLVAIGLLLIWLLVTASPSRVLHLGLGLVLAGAVGNLYDRWHWQKVRDFVLIYLGDFESPSWRYPNFNLADSMIVVGVGMILWEELFGRRRRERRAAATP
jgi:signal peptidase II